MYIFPAIDLYEGKAVRLLHGDYEKMTVYSDNPSEFAADFEAQGAKHIHIVDLAGAKTGETPNLEIVKSIVHRTNLFAEVGGGIRSMETIKKYVDSGVGRVILGTAAVKDPAFLEEALYQYKDKIAVGVDIKDGKVSVNGWTEKSEFSTMDFCEKMQTLGVSTLICTDISRDGAMRGTNLALYKELSQRFSMQIIASGGVSSLDDIKALAEMNLYGAIVGKAYYEKAFSIREAVEVAE